MASPTPVPSNSPGRWRRWNAPNNLLACRMSKPTPLSRTQTQISAGLGMHVTVTTGRLAGLGVLDRVRKEVGEDLPHQVCVARSGRQFVQLPFDPAGLRVRLESGHNFVEHSPQIGHFPV